jgi:hypothetical protein
VLIVGGAALLLFAAEALAPGASSCCGWDSLPTVVFIVVLAVPAARCWRRSRRSWC